MAVLVYVQELAWSTLTITSKVQPTARSGHVATVHSGDLLVFGGEETSVECRGSQSVIIGWLSCLQRLTPSFFAGARYSSPVL